MEKLSGITGTADYVVETAQKIRVPVAVDSIF